MKYRQYRNYLLVVLLLLMAFSLVDRMALGIVLQNIKADLHLSDTQLGLLSGIAFALFYSVMGLPIARWADRGNRVTIISLTAAVWSVMVALCAVASSFGQLLLIRIGVGVGEAGCVPPAHSLIADYFTRAERPRAVAVYALGAPLSYVIGYFLAGWLNELYGWRATFMFLAAPGVILAILVRLTLREPRCTSPASNAASPVRSEVQALVSQPRLVDVCAILWANVTFRHLLFGFCLIFFFAYGIGQWQPAFFIRSYGVKTGTLGTWFAAVYGLGGLLGTYWGGELAMRYALYNERRQLNMMVGALCLAGTLSALVYLSVNQYLAFALLAVFSTAFNSISGPLLAIIQTLIPQRMRATAIALIYLFANLIGMGLGPLATGALSDALRPWVGQESLRYALLALSPGYLWAAWHLSRAGTTVAGDLGDLQLSDQPGGIAADNRVDNTTACLVANSRS